MRALLVVVAIAACGRSSSPPDVDAVTCAHYAKLFASCAKSEQKAAAEETADNLCHKGLSGKYEEMFGARYRAMIACSRTAETCDALRACEGTE